MSWPLAARAQPSAIGYLSSRSPDTDSALVAAFRQGLHEMGHVEGRDFTIEFRWARNQTERLRPLAADLVGRRVAVIVAATGTGTALAAKAATGTIPIIFNTGGDPVNSGLVASLNRPGGNLTGVAQVAIGLLPKMFEVLWECAAMPKLIAVLVNPTSSVDPRPEELELAARTLGVRLLILEASNPSEIDGAFAALAQQGASALLVRPDAFLNGRVEQLGSLAARYAIPAIHRLREFAIAGGLMSYGSSLSDSYRLAGNFAGRILKGDTAADLPVMQPTKFELVINLKIARTLGLAVPQTLRVLATEVIE
jgi:putative ABC transport system substrate-binding protein